MVHMGNMSPVPHTHFSTKERACLRRQPAQRKTEPREKQDCAGQSTETRSRDLAAQEAFLNNEAFHWRSEAKIGLNMMKEVEVRIWRLKINSSPGRANSMCKDPGAA